MTETLQPFASHPETSRGRRFPEPESKTRTAFQRDRDRLLLIHLLLHQKSRQNSHQNPLNLERIDHLFQKRNLYLPK